MGPQSSLDAKGLLRGEGRQPASGQLPEQGCFLSARTVYLDSCEEDLKTLGPVPSHAYPCSSKGYRCSQTILRFFLSTFVYFSLCVHVNGQDGTGTRVKVRGQLAGVSLLLLPCGSWRLNSGRQVWQQMPLHTKPSCWFPQSPFFFFN